MTIAWLRKSGIGPGRQPIVSTLLLSGAIAVALAASPIPPVAAQTEQAAPSESTPNKAPDIVTPNKAPDTELGTLADENYRLGGGDRLRIRFYDRYDRDDLNGEYVIGQSGQLRLPRIGVFDARDKTPSELEREIGLSVENRGEKLGYFTIDIAQCRPFYVAGLANRPGSYPYLPGYTVLHAVSVAGGLYRTPLASIADSMREKRVLTQTMDRLAELVARRVRLEAERDNAAEIRMPRELAELEPVRGVELIASETNLLQRSREVTKRERLGLERAIDLASAEVETYRAGIARTTKRIEEQTAVFDQLKTLHDQRVINQQRVFEATAAVDAAQRDKQTVVIGLSRATNDLEKAQKELSLLALSASSRIAKEIAEAEREIARLKTVAAETRRLVSTLDTLSGGGSGQAVTYRIMRRAKSGELTFEQATETTAIMPGDVIQIESQNGPATSGQLASLDR